ncbi:porin family protein [Microbulbifer bruguierae]|uniref:Porin family protein n=1 Tax=Microbulbifer bruguierae TaxID=3029061 RepID=A0ABY8NDN9_9GAMM|nr:porin family protein [Microbulbifer bruguierae]WGL15543.1 porin family protein [Microbulbifer bruguierae]
MKASAIKLASAVLGALCLSAPLQAQQNFSDDAGFYIGGGIFSAANSDCSECEYTGQALEIGYDFNDIVGVEVKYASGESDYDDELNIQYVGANIGHDFNTGWFRLYGKVGLGSIEETFTYQGGCYDYYYCVPTYTESYTSTGTTLGIGARFTLSGTASGLYLKAETMGVAYEDESVGVAFLLGTGYRF